MIGGLTEGGKYCPWLLQPLFPLYRHKWLSLGRQATLGQSQCSAVLATLGQSSAVQCSAVQCWLL